MEITVSKVTLTDRECAEVLTTALEGGIGYWCAASEVSRDGEHWVIGFVAEDTEAEDEEDAAFEPYSLDLATVRRGLDIIYGVRPPEVAPRHGVGGVDLVGHPLVKGQVENDFDIDADGADIIVQAGLFGVHVFG